MIIIVVTLELGVQRIKNREKNLLNELASVRWNCEGRSGERAVATLAEGGTAAVNAGAGGSHHSRQRWGWGWLPRSSTLVVRWLS